MYGRSDCVCVCVCVCVSWREREYLDQMRVFGPDN